VGRETCPSGKHEWDRVYVDSRGYENCGYCRAERKLAWKWRPENIERVRAWDREQARKRRARDGGEANRRYSRERREREKRKKRAKVLAREAAYDGLYDDDGGQFVI
jgi:hypothetical protein